MTCYNPFSWAKGMLRPQSRLEGRKPSVRASGREHSVPMTIVKKLWCTKLSKVWPQYPGFILVDLLAKWEAVCLIFWGFCFGCNRSPVSYWAPWTGSRSQTGDTGKGWVDYQGSSSNWGSGWGTCSSRKPKCKMGLTADTVNATEAIKGLGASP